jgi:hypothetical protein
MHTVEKRLKGPPPLLLVDIDGVLSIFGFDHAQPPHGRWLLVDGIAHYLASDAAARLQRLAEAFEPVWCSGWEEKANEYLPAALGLGPWPHLAFDAAPGVRSHWKLAAIDAYAGAERPVAWIDDAHGEASARWARDRAGHTLLVRTEPSIGLSEEHVAELVHWAGIHTPTLG